MASCTIWMLISLCLPTEPPSTICFQKEEVGRLPVGWEASQTGEGTGSIWKVTSDASSPSGSGYVLAQTAKGPKALYNIATLKQSSFLNGTVEVQFKAIAGEVDQGGGLVWRYQDANNYYICRFNPLEDNYRLYKVIDGKRVQLATKEQLTPPQGKWHSISIKHTGKTIECRLDGAVLLNAEDDAITKPGRIGLWTKADAQTHFDVLHLSPLRDK